MNQFGISQNGQENRTSARRYPARLKLDLKRIQEFTRIQQMEMTRS